VVVAKLQSGVAWAVLAILWAVVFAPLIADLLYAFEVDLTWAEYDLLVYLPALFMGLLAVRDLHKAKQF
jgi:hypothetical protein